MTIYFEYISTNGVRLHTALAGAQGGVPVFLLHGFPDPGLVGKRRSRTGSLKGLIWWGVCKIIFSMVFS